MLQLDGLRTTPAVRHNDGLDYVPTNKYVLFGHHFAAIAGAGPLVGPVLAAQMGYMPGMLWILAGVVFAGAVQDFVVLFISMRRDGRSLGDLIKMELGLVPGVIALFGTFLIMVIILAVLALIVVKALTGSPWGTFTVGATIPVAIFMGIYTRYIRPGKIGEVSIIGFVGLMLAIVYGQYVAESATLAPFFTFTGTQLTWILIGYGFIAVGAAGVAAARAARLSVDVPQDRHDPRPRDRHPDRRARAEDAGVDEVHRRQRPGLVGQPVPVPVHHDRVRRGVGLPRADLVGHDAQADRQRSQHALHRLRRDADGIVRRDHGAGRRLA